MVDRTVGTFEKLVTPGNDVTSISNPCTVHAPSHGKNYGKKYCKILNKVLKFNNYELN